MFRFDLQRFSFTFDLSPSQVTCVAGQSSATEVTCTVSATQSDATYAFSKVNGPTWAMCLTTGLIAIQPNDNVEPGTYTLTVKCTKRIIKVLVSHVLMMNTYIDGGEGL